MPSDAPQPDVSIGDVSSSTFAIGSHAHAESHQVTSASPDRDSEQLLVAILDLRAYLARVRATGQTAELDAALADTEGEITRIGTPDESRLRRLRELLAGAESLTAVLTSAGAVVGLLGM
ncbi:hypothetical protein [Streptomyces sp. NPDC048565]|uniref:hypothetical protein n=1 Tax=Streptomyces sp. NPDC048565 TaxID=3155266 RepID=UPI00344A58FE